MSKCTIYGDMTDEELAAKIAELRGHVEQVAIGGVAVVVAGEGRRIEYSRANEKGLLALLAAASREKARRAGVQVSGAIQVTYPYGLGGI